MRLGRVGHLIDPFGGKAVAPTPTTALYRDADVLDAARAALEATGAFDAVLEALPEERGEGAAGDLLAVVETAAVGGGTESQDFVDAGGVVINTHKYQANITIIVRDESAATRNRVLDQLCNVAHNAIAGQNFGGLTIPAWTRIDRFGDVPAKSPERRKRAVFRFAYLVADGGHGVGD